MASTTGGGAWLAYCGAALDAALLCLSPSRAEYGREDERENEKQKGQKEKQQKIKKSSEAT
jgi:hypothetical protein